MKKLVIKVGQRMDDDLQEAFFHPKKSDAGTHTLYLKNEKDLSEILSPKNRKMLSKIRKIH